MLADRDMGTPERIGRILKFYMLRGFELGLYASALHFEGDLDAVRRNAVDIENADFSTVFDDDDDDISIN